MHTDMVDNDNPPSQNNYEILKRQCPKIRSEIQNIFWIPNEKIRHVYS